MKKSFLLIVLFALVFLGLGKYSLAEDVNETYGNATYSGPSECVGYFRSATDACTLDASSFSCTNFTSKQMGCMSCIASAKTWSNNQCVDNTPPAGNNTCDPTNPGACDQTVAERAQKCPTATVTPDNVGYVNKDVDGNCCSQGGEVPGLSTCDPSKLTENQPGVPCNPPSGGNLNAMGFCACPTGTKNVNGTCTSCKAAGVCCGISLNTSIPFIGNCIEDSAANKGPGETDVTGTTAFPTLMGSLTKILVTVILIVSFVLIIVGGIMIATGNPSGGKKMIINVVIGIALLGASGVILRLINPNFFG